MRFFFNPRKAAQAAAYLAQLSGGSMSVLALIKLLYLADREALIHRGFPITGDRMVSMPHGPVLSQIYDQIKLGEEEGQPLPWYEYLTERDQNQVSLRPRVLVTDELSDFERELLSKVHQEYSQLSPWQLRRLTHDLPEYQDPKGSSLPISPIDILREAGWSDEDVRGLATEAEENYFLNALIGA